MPSATTDSIEYLTLDGPIEVPLACLIGIALAGLFAWSLRRERHILGRKETVLFWCLRTLAVFFVVWMLLSPSACPCRQDNHSTSGHRRSGRKRKHEYGRSGPMEPMTFAGCCLVRGRGRPALRCRPIEPSLQSVLRSFNSERPIESLQAHETEQSIVDALILADEALNRTHQHLSNARMERTSPNLSSEVGTLLRRAGNGLIEPEFQDFSRLCSALKKGRSPSQVGWRESLPDLQYRLTKVREMLSDVAGTIAQSEATRVTLDQPERLNSVSNATRLHRAVAFLDQLEETSIPELNKHSDFHWASFDETVVPLPNSLPPKLRSLSEKLDSHEDDKPTQRTGSRCTVGTRWSTATACRGSFRFL